MLPFLTLIADIDEPIGEKTIFTKIPFGKIIATIQSKRFREPQTFEFLIDSGTSFTTLLPYHVLSSEINCDYLPTASKPCFVANGQPIYPKLLYDVNISINSYFQGKRGEENFVLPFIHLMPPNTQQVLPRTLSLLGMDVLRNFSSWHWDYRTYQLFLNK